MNSTQLTDTNALFSLRDTASLSAALLQIAHPLLVCRSEGALAFHLERNGGGSGRWADPESQACEAWAPACPLEHLGDAEFRAAHGVKYAYYAGAMANGIASTRMVEALSRAGMLSFFGAAGLPLPEVERAVLHLAAAETGSYGFNLIHSPNEPALESGAVDLYLRHGVHLVEASAYLDLTLPVVRYRVQGLHRNAEGQVVAPNRVIAKVSRVEVASKFMAPPPEALLDQLVQSDIITREQAVIAREIPMAGDITAEADSGGHTDNRPAITLLPTLIALRDRMQREYAYASPLRVGLAGGIATPEAAAAAFAMGAAYIVTGTVNQACVESGTSDEVRKMLAEAEQADVVMAPAADMFEMGVNLQVLKRGTMFSMRARRLYELYRAHESLEAIPAEERAKLEKTVFRMPLDQVWAETQRFFEKRDPIQISRAAKDPKHKMALLFRWYLGQSSRWANQGESGRKIDYQVWCGPSMGAFNEWAKGSFLEAPGERAVVTVAMNLLFGAAFLVRCNSLRFQGVHLPGTVCRTAPRTLHEIEGYLK